MTIRDALPADYEAIDCLCREAYAEFEAIIGTAHWERMRAGLAQAEQFAGSGVLIVAETAGGLAGSVAYFPPGQSDGVIFPREWASLRLLAVAPAHRGKGIGRCLTEECIARARRQGAGKLGLHTAAMMAVARPMYERMGFHKDGDLQPRFGVPYARYVLDLSAGAPEPDAAVDRAGFS